MFIFLLHFFFERMMAAFYARAIFDGGGLGGVWHQIFYFDSILDVDLKDDSMLM